MSRAAAGVLGVRLVAGIVSGPRGPGLLPATLEHVEGGHPLPDHVSVHAALRALALANEAARSDELLLVLVSGGGSAMLAVPSNGISLPDKRQTVEGLMRAGTPIGALNCVRKHLSGIKGGRLGPSAHRLTLAISDVHEPQDDPAAIASGPTVADSTTFADAMRVIDESGAAVPRSVRTHLKRGISGLVPETPKPGDSDVRPGEFRVLANRHTAMASAAREAAVRGYTVLVRDAPFQGEASVAGWKFVESVLSGDAPALPQCVIASGETTVTVRGAGLGGRNQEFALGAAGSLGACPHPALVASAGTDGIDGPTDAAGAMVTSATLLDAERKRVDLSRALAANDAYPALDALGALIKWGPTFTNVGDICIALISGAPHGSRR